MDKYINEYIQEWGQHLVLVAPKSDISLNDRDVFFLSHVGVPGETNTFALVFHASKIFLRKICVGNVTYTSITEDIYMEAYVQDRTGNVYVAVHTYELEDYEMTFFCESIIDFFLLMTKYQQTIALVYQLDTETGESTFKVSQNEAIAISHKLRDYIVEISPRSMNSKIGSSNLWSILFPLLSLV